MRGLNEFESEARILGLERNLVDLQRETSQKLEEIIQKDRSAGTFGSEFGEASDQTFIFPKSNGCPKSNYN